MSYREVAGAEIVACRDDPARFNATVLGRGAYWHRQREICRSVVERPITLVPSGNGVGKSYVAAGLLHWFLIAYPGSLVVATAPSQVQLEEVLWKEVERAYRGSRIPLGGRLLASPLKVELGAGWQALAYSTTRVERFSGHHAQDLLAIGDEASGILDDIAEAICGLNPSRELWLGNPLRPSGFFFDRCESARSGRHPLASLIPISSLESPHIELERSPWGLADRTWLEKARADYGEGSLWWTCHVLGLFPDTGADSVLPLSWIDRAGAAPHVPRGPARMAIDLALGGGGDRSVVMVADDHGVIAGEWSNTWPLEQTATRAGILAQRHHVDGHRISWDAEGIGADFANRLQAESIHDARPYRGGRDGGPKFANFRAAAAWGLRRRLDPGRTVPGASGPVPQAPFAIPPSVLHAAREELAGLRYTLDERGRIKLERKDEYAKRLRRSPDLADGLCQLFACPDG